MTETTAATPDVRRPSSVERIGDPRLRAVRAGQAGDRAAELVATWSRIRRDAVREMHTSGMSMSVIADAIGVSKSQVQRLLETRDDDA